MVKRCAHGTCNSDDRYPDRVQEVTFFPFPKPKSNLERCLKWIKACNRPSHQLNIHTITRNTYVCSKHFKNEKGPTDEYPDPLQAVQGDQVVQKPTKKKKNSLSHEDGCYDTGPSTSGDTKSDKMQDADSQTENTWGFLSFFISMGNTQSFGVFYYVFLDYFGSSKRDTSWIASLNSGLLLGFGPVVGVLAERFGCRTTSIIGAVLIATGMVSSMFIQNIYMLYLTYGIIVGIGYSFTLITGTLAVNLQFDKHRTLAVGVCSAGTGVGAMVFPVLGTVLINQFGWRGTFLIYAGVGLQGFICAVAFGILPVPRKRRAEEQISTDDKTFLGRTKGIFSTVPFSLFAASGFLVYMGYFVPFIMLQDMVIKSGTDESTAALMITMSGVASIIARVIIGFLSDLQYISRLVINAVGLMSLGILTSLCSLYGTTVFFVYTAYLGAVTGIFGMYQSVIAVEIIGMDDICLAVGYINLLEGIAVVIGPPFAGYISDVSDSYTIAFLYSGGLLFMGGVFSLLSFASRKCAKQKSLS